VTPLQSGTATPQGGGNNININIPITGGANADIPARAAALVYQKLKEIFVDG
jgi:hypothetical protein